MVNQYQFLEENEWDYDPVEEEEEPDFDRIVAQNLTDQQFIEQNVQLPSPEPAPQVEIAPPIMAPEAQGQPSLVDSLLGNVGAWAQPDPALPPELAIQQGAPWQGMLDDIYDQQSAYDDVSQSLDAIMPANMLSTITPQQLDVLEGHRGFPGIGPLAGLNREIADKNFELNDIISQLQVMNPENFTKQSQVDAYNDLVHRGQAIESEIGGIIGRYQETGEGLIEEQEELIESLYGQNGSVKRFNELYGPGGVMDHRREVARYDTRGHIAVDEDLYQMFREGYFDFDIGSSSFTPTDKLIEAQNQAVREQSVREQRERRRRQTLELGFTSEQFAEFADDPGFQEFLGQITDLDVPDALLESLDVTRLAGLENPYGGGDPVPLQSILTYAPGSRTEESFLRSSLAAPFAPLTLLPGSDAAMTALNVPGEFAAESVYQNVRDTVDRFRIPYDLLVGNDVDTGAVWSPSGSRQREIDQDYEQFRENHPWLTLGMEVVFDPLNIISVGLAKNVLKGTRFASDVRLIRGSTSLAVEQAAKENTLASRRYLDAVADIGSNKLSKIDGIKLARTEARFATVATNSLGVSQDSAVIFGNRLTHRLYASPETHWANILNEELGRLAETTGKQINAQNTARFNRELTSESAFALLDGNDFWKSIGADFPKALQDTPQWRRARQQNLPNPDNIWVPQPNKPVSIDDLVAQGYGPNLALDERWAAHADASRSRQVIPANSYSLKYLQPSIEPVAPKGVSDDMVTVLNRMYKANNKTLEAVPQTLDDYWKAWRALDDTPDLGFTPTKTADDVTHSPHFQWLYANTIGDLADGLIPTWSDRPVTVNQIASLQAAGFLHGRDFLDELLDPLGGLGAPASQTRFNWIYDRMPATEWKRAQIREIATAKNLKVPDNLDTMSFKDVNDWVAHYMKDVKQPQDVVTVHSTYTQSISELVRHERDAIFEMEFRAVIADLMLPSGEGRYTFTRPVKRPDGTTANGWARLSQWELLNAIANAGPNITHLPNIGPAIDELIETVSRMRKARTGNRPWKEAASYPTLLAKTDEILESIVDDVLQNASPAEIYDFKNWLVDLYDKSYLGRPGRKASPRDILPDDPNLRDLDASLSETAVRQAERTMIDDKLGRFRAVSELTDWSHGGQKHSLDWRKLTAMGRDEAVTAIRAHFNDPNSPMTLDGFYDLLRQAKFHGPGGPPQTIRDILTEIARLQDAHGRVTREIVDWGDRSQRIASKLGVDDISNLTNLSPEPMIQHHLQEFRERIPEYAQYDPNFSLPNLTPDATKTLLKTSTQETTAAVAETLARGRARPSWHQTSPVWEAKIFDGRPRYITRGAWDGTPELNGRLQRTFNEYNQGSANRMPVNEIAAKLTSTNIPFAADDLTSQALLIQRYSFKEIADAAGISQLAAKRLKRAISDELTRGTSIHPTTVTNDAKRLGGMIDIADTFYTVLSEQPRRLADDPEPSKIQLVAGKLQIPDGLVDHFTQYLDDQYKLSLLHQPGALTKAAAESTRRVLGLVLDFAVFGVTDRQASHRVMTVFGPGGSQFIRPRHQRPMVPTFDPLGSRLNQINWALHGSAFDQIIHSYYDVDPVWGRSVQKRLDPRNMGELTKLSKGTKIGDITSFVGHTVFHNVLESVKRKRENMTDIYSEIVSELDEIVYGGPAAQMRYGEMFASSEEMGRWLTWSRQKVTQGMVQPDGAIKAHHVGLTMWDVVKDNWGDITPHLSVSRMPTSLQESIFAPTRSGLSRRRRSLNRAPVVEDAERLHRFITDFDNFTKELELNDFERMEAELWRDALEPIWGEKHQEFRDGISGEFLRGIHVDDLDNLFGLDALDPFDAQRFADKMGTVASRLELERLGFTNVSLGLKLSQAIKATFGFFWLRAAPRYIINNVYGNIVSLILNQSRSERASGLRKQPRIMDGLSYKSSSLYSHRMMSSGLTTTEFAWGGPQGVAVDRTKPAAKRALFRQKADGRFARVRNSSTARTAGHHTRRLSRAYFDMNADLTDWFEIDARSRVWSNEFDFNYQNMWERGLDTVDGLDPALREKLASHVELSDISRVLRDAGADDLTRAQVFRAHNTSSATAHLRAYTATKDVMRDYLMRNRFDNMLDQIFPYHFWMTKNLMFVTGTVMDRPATVLQGARVYDTWQEQWQELPYSFREKIHIKKVPGFVPVLGGREIGVRPDNMTNPAFLILPAVIDEMSDAWKRYEHMPIYQRFARTTAGGTQRMYEEIGYSSAPHIDLITGVTTSNAVDQMVRGMSNDDVAFWKDQLDRGLIGVTNPKGYDRELVPLGGLEDVVLWQVGDKDIVPGDKKSTVRALYAWMNRNVKGSDFTNGEMTAMGKIAFEMLHEGEITEDEFEELNRLVKTQNYNELEAHPVAKNILDRLYAQQGERSGINYGSALSFTELRPIMREAVEVQEEYLKRKAEDEEIPIPKNATKAQELMVRGFNRNIQDLRSEVEEYGEVRNFSSDAVAEMERMYDLGLRTIYNEAHKAGIEVPQLGKYGPDSALDYILGEWNPQTGKREGGAAPWIIYFWSANDNAEDLALADVRDRSYEQKAQKRDANNQLWQERSERRGKAAPYWEQIDAAYEQERVDILDIRSRDLSETAEMRLVDQAMDRTKREIAKIFSAAEQEGISLKGFGTVPQHTPAWYDLSESNNGDIRYIYEQAGLGVPRDRELLTSEQAIMLNRVEDQIEAHTTWAMRQVVDAGDLNPYLPSGEPNPRFMRDGYFSRELWEQTVQKEAPQIMRLYDGIVRSYVDPDRGMTRRANYGEAEPVDLLARRDLSFDELFTFLKDDVLSRQSAFDMGLSATLDRYFNASGNEKDMIYRQGVTQFGVTFMDIANSEQIRVDMDEVATTISNFYNGLTGDEKASFEEQWGDHIIDGGDIRVIDSDTLTYSDALVISERYGLEIPTYRQQYDMSNKRHALSSVWDQLSKEQQAEFKEAWGADETLPDDFILTVSGTDKESGEPYTYQVPAWEALDERQIAKLIRQLDAPVDSYYPDEDEIRGSTTPRSPRFQQMLADAARDKEVEVVTEAFHSGEAFLSDPKDVEGWQSVQALREQYPDLYEAGRNLIEENGVSWEWLVENLEPRQKQGGEDFLTLREFAEIYVYTLEQVDYSRLVNDQRKWLRGEGQEYPSLLKYLDDRDPTVEDALAQAEAGTLYGFEGQDLENWQAFYQWREANDHLYTAAQIIKSENDVTWAQLAAGLEDGPLKEFAEEYIKKMADYDMPRLWDQRGNFFLTEHGQSLIARDPDEFAGFVDLDGGSSSSGSGSGYRGGGRSFGSSGSSNRRPPSSSGKVLTDYSTDVRDIFRLDSAMMTGDAPDAQARYDAAIEVADLIEKRLEWSYLILGQNNDWARIMIKLWTRQIQQILGENPTLDLWKQVLQMLGGGEPPPQPSDAMLAEEDLIAAD